VDVVVPHLDAVVVGESVSIMSDSPDFLTVLLAFVDLGVLFPLGFFATR